MGTKVCFLRDFRSAATGERAYAAGAVAEFAEDDAQKIIAEGAATLADPRAPVDKPVEDQPSAQQRAAARDRAYWSGKFRHLWRPK